MCKGKVRTYGRSTGNNVRETSCLTDFDAKSGSTGTIVSSTVFELDLISLHGMTQNSLDYHMTILDFQSLENLQKYQSIS